MKTVKRKWGWKIRLSVQNQMSESFCNSAVLALSGGFQDAYTYNTRNEVFPMLRQEM